ncbi:allantoicase [Streptomyces boncukensis]|uniref:Probable allantoicase n=1 Tax=Streptomyces boncukensis TaxID=2711219 RepID=A0A6G4X4G5_9ACTN|nr:allantoicase [Streptomyces boncukensis]NGO72429.1 allantoicase [Streptomyces boncukensis]
MSAATPATCGIPIPRYEGDARPYGGGDPYADYRAPADGFPFDRLPDLADRRLGAAVIAANDEFFAERENLLRPERPEFDPAAFGHKGKVMDGWETRRRRGASAAVPHPAAGDHDWALIRLGAPGAVRGLVVDTAHFRGNYPREVAVEAVSLPGTPSPAELLAEGVPWTTLVPRTRVAGHAANGFAVTAERRFTHLRLRQHPDGGIARLRVYGEAVPEPEWLAALGTFDLVALEHGGRAEDASDRFFSPPVHTILPGRSRKMDEGWETRRRRDDGHDWVRYALAAQARVRAVELDTGCYKGNAAGWVSLAGRDGEGGAWSELLPRTRLEPDAVHRFVLADAPPVTQVRMDIFPDGGVARLRLHGSLTGEGARQLAARYAELA